MSGTRRKDDGTGNVYPPPDNRSSVDEDAPARKLKASYQSSSSLPIRSTSLLYTDTFFTRWTAGPRQKVQMGGCTICFGSGLILREVESAPVFAALRVDSVVTVDTQTC